VAKNWLLAAGSLPVTVEETLIDGWTMPNVALVSKFCLKLVPNLRALPVIERKKHRFLTHVKQWKKWESFYSFQQER
jgi:hypothetical protein